MGHGGEAEGGEAVTMPGPWCESMPKERELTSVLFFTYSASA